MIHSLYRFRPLERVLEKGELENQEVFLAPPSSLNDPVEGYMDLYWKGDEIVWKNLFRNYLICLEHVFGLIQLSEEDDILTNNDIPVFLSASKLPTSMYQDKFKNICNEFFEDDNIDKLIRGLASRTKETRKDELLFYLKIVHSRAVSIIANANQPSLKTKDDIALKQNSILEKLVSDDFIKIPDFKNEASGGIDKDTIFSIGQSLNEQMQLIHLYKNPMLMDEKKKLFLLFEFPQRYVQQLENLMYPPWYTACFMENVNNASMWGHYGDSHRGICLKFKTTPMPHGQIGLVLNQITSYSSSKKGTSKNRSYKLLPLHKVRYDSKYPSVDFFNSIGRLPLPDLFQHWYSDENGNRSTSEIMLMQNESAWRTQFWKTFYESNTVKLDDWKYETEHRLILASSLSDLIEKEDRILRYKFSDLEGIVFGINTPIEAKVRIMKIIEKKCDDNRCYDFKFYQAAYSHRNGKIEINELLALKFASGVTT